MTALKDDEARGKWCPFARAVYAGTDQSGDADSGAIMVPHNRVHPHDDTVEGVIASGYCECVTSNCMAWRWFDPEPAEQENDDDRRGYCGLVGKPGFAA